MSESRKKKNICIKLSRQNKCTTLNIVVLILRKKEAISNPAELTITCYTEKLRLLTCTCEIVSLEQVRIQHE